MESHAIEVAIFAATAAVAALLHLEAILSYWEACV